MCHRPAVQQLQRLLVPGRLNRSLSRSLNPNPSLSLKHRLRDQPPAGSQPRHRKKRQRHRHRLAAPLQKRELLNLNPSLNLSLNPRLERLSLSQRLNPSLNFRQGGLSVASRLTVPVLKPAGPRRRLNRRKKTRCLMMTKTQCQPLRRNRLPG
jgi:hypothetical protein